MTLEWRDGADQPAIFGAGPARPWPLLARGLPPIWSAADSAPTVPGVYHAVLRVGQQGVPTTTIILTEPLLTVITPTHPLRSGLVYDVNGQLWLHSAADTQSRKLTFFTGTESAREAAWSPDGQRIAYTYDPPVPLDQIPTGQIWSIRPDGSDAQPLVVPQPGEDLMNPAWSSDGQRVLFTLNRQIDPATGQPPPPDNPYSGQDSWSVAQFDRASGTRRDLVANATMAQFSPDGTQLIYISAPVPSTDPGLIVPRQLLIAHADGSAPRVLVGGEAFLDLSGPRVSPDGRWVAFAAPSFGQSRAPRGVGPSLVSLRHPGSVPWDVFVVAVSGGPPRRLTRWQSDLPALAWAADAQHLAVLNDQGLFRVALDDSPAQRLGPGVGHSSLSWYDP